MKCGYQFGELALGEDGCAEELGSIRVDGLGFSTGEKRGENFKATAFGHAFSAYFLESGIADGKSHRGQKPWRTEVELGDIHAGRGFAQADGEVLSELHPCRSALPRKGSKPRGEAEFLWNPSAEPCGSEQAELEFAGEENA